MLYYESERLKKILKTESANEAAFFGRSTRLYGDLHNSNLPFLGIQIIYHLNDENIGEDFIKDDTRKQARDYIELLEKIFDDNNIKFKTLYFDVIDPDIISENKRTPISKLLIYANVLRNDISNIEQKIITDIKGINETLAIKMSWMEGLFFNLENPIIINNGYDAKSFKGLVSTSRKRYIWNFKLFPMFQDDGKPDEFNLENYEILTNIAFSHGQSHCSQYRKLLKEKNYEQPIKNYDPITIQYFLEGIGLYKFKIIKEKIDNSVYKILHAGLEKPVLDRLNNEGETVGNLMNNEGYNTIYNIYIQSSCFIPILPSGEDVYKDLTSQQVQDLEHKGYSKESFIKEKDLRNNDLIYTGIHYIKYYLLGFLKGVDVHIRYDALTDEYIKAERLYCYFRGVENSSDQNYLHFEIYSNENGAFDKDAKPDSDEVLTYNKYLELFT